MNPYKLELETPYQWNDKFGMTDLKTGLPTAMKLPAACCGVYFHIRQDLLDSLKRIKNKSSGYE
jgi:hypothetical protein